jgi:hypothetical protein
MKLPTQVSRLIVSMVATIALGAGVLVGTHRAHATCQTCSGPVCSARCATGDRHGCANYYDPISDCADCTNGYPDDTAGC